MFSLPFFFQFIAQSFLIFFHLSIFSVQLLLLVLTYRRTISQRRFDRVVFVALSFSVIISSVLNLLFSVLLLFLFLRSLYPHSLCIRCSVFTLFLFFFLRTLELLYFPFYKYHIHNNGNIFQCCNQLIIKTLMRQHLFFTQPLHTTIHLLMCVVFVHIILFSLSSIQMVPRIFFFQDLLGDLVAFR